MALQRLAKGAIQFRKLQLSATAWGSIHMLAVRGTLERRQAIVRIGLQRFDLQASSVEPEQQHVPLPIIAYRALVDTGAQRTCLTYQTIEAERLSRHGNRFIQNVHSEVVHSLYFASIGFYINGVRGSMEDRVSYYALPEPTEVINIANNDKFDAMVGMDVLRFFDVQFHRTGHFEIFLN